MARLEEKVCLITGGTSGIGREIARIFAREGAAVAIMGTSRTRGAEIEKELKGFGKEVLFVPADVTREEQWQEAVALVTKKFGKLDVLVNCAGIFGAGTITEMGSSAFEKIMRVNVGGAFLGMKACIPVMEEKGEGSVINIASEAGIAAIPGQTAYNTSKAAVIMLTKSGAVDYGAKGIRINCICPGRVHTEMVQKILEQADDYERQYEKLSKDRPMQHMGEPKDIAYAALYLACEEAKYVTGAVLCVDGGYVCP